ncbi:Hsp20/alpha crystallin family protein [Lishizhenia sp.]|uniref:Hsp20/alpha crystallin family protein n=1 Tax=Lishizhenia sp. TaxID=2497594 RepID=UPI00299F3093|nr:Hsp20/alpha crystallin family protein [Lishizhenia sp.]MDX1446704.1 Hsp20/alpha crystallin family protein [Lishizhenia sp.]
MSLIKHEWPTLSDFFDESWMKNRFSNASWSTAVNVVDNEENYEIEVAAPGLKKDEFSVSCENGVLNISGQTKKEDEEKKKNYTRKEFSSKSFSKSFTLPENVDANHIDATYNDGVLKLTLHKVQKELPPKKEITIA